MRDLIAKYLPKASRGARSAPLLVADAGADEAAETAAAEATAVDAAEALVADARTPRARPAIEADDAACCPMPRRRRRPTWSSQAMAEAEVTEVSEEDAEAPPRAT